MLPKRFLVPAVLGSLSVCSYGQDFATPDAPATTTERLVVTGTGISSYVAEDAVSATKTDTALLDTPQTVPSSPARCSTTRPCSACPRR